MLLDRDRNFRFKQAIREAIKEKHLKREMANVIDIGSIGWVNCNLRVLKNYHSSKKLWVGEV